MNKAKTIAISAMCSAVAFGCMLLATLPGVRYVALILGVVASIAVVVPIMVDVRNLVYTLLTYAVSGALALGLGLSFFISNFVFVMPILVFCIPFAVVKVWGESFKVTAEQRRETVLEDPFDSANDKKMVEVRVGGKRRLPAVVRWVLYYILLEIALGLCVLMLYFVTPAVLDELIANKILWVIIAVMQLAVYPYDMLMRGCLLGTRKILQKAIKPQ
ncbi:MAG: hypothetical protein NC132_05155 [Corallococcus sp.]|nr:hypothetical protein [Corallococcus sp.]MCM1359925.1 hypothetical protein [Corallococcus sp.]MCM1395481.1 hypothetical protein [Corallococcus sp.]